MHPQLLYRIRAHSLRLYCPAQVHPRNVQSASARSRCPEELTIYLTKTGEMQRSPTQCAPSLGLSGVRDPSRSWETLFNIFIVLKDPLTYLPQSMVLTDIVPRLLKWSYFEVTTLSLLTVRFGACGRCFFRDIASLNSFKSIQPLLLFTFTFIGVSNKGCLHVSADRQRSYDKYRFIIII